MSRMNIDGFLGRAVKTGIAAETEIQFLFKDAWIPSSRHDGIRCNHNSFPAACFGRNFLKNLLGICSPEAKQEKPPDISGKFSVISDIVIV